MVSPQLKVSPIAVVRHSANKLTLRSVRRKAEFFSLGPNTRATAGTEFSDYYCATVFTKHLISPPRLFVLLSFVLFDKIQRGKGVKTLKLDIDCVRDVMLELEEFPMGYQLLSAFKKSIEKHGEDNVVYTLSKLDEAKFINAEIGIDESGYPHCMAVYNLTFQGHEFLNSIRSPGVWEQLQGAAREGSVESIKAIGSIALSLLEEMLKKKLGLQS